jgi:hypothetical protein
MHEVIKHDIDDQNKFITAVHILFSRLLLLLMPPLTKRNHQMCHGF